MVGVFQVAASCLAQIQLLNSEFQFAVVVAIYLVIGPASAALLYWLRFGHWFRLLLEGSGQRRMVLLLFALEAAMEVFFILQMETQPEYLVLYYLLVLVMAALITGLVVYLSQQVDEGELDALWTALRSWMRALTGALGRRSRPPPRPVICASPKYAASCWPKEIRCPYGYLTPTLEPSIRTVSGWQAFPPKGRAGEWAWPATSGFWRTVPTRPHPQAGRAVCPSRN